MKEEKETWLDQLKQQVNEYEKPLPENDWNDFEEKLFIPYLHKKRKMKIMHTAAIFFLLFIPVATTFYFLQTDDYKQKMPIQSTPLYRPEIKIIKPSPMTEHGLLPADKKSEIAPLAESGDLIDLPLQKDSIYIQTAHEQSKASTTDNADSIKTEKKHPAQQAIHHSRQLPGESSKPTDFIGIRKHSEYALALTVSAGNNGARTGFINKAFSRGEPGSPHKDETMYWSDFKNYLQECPADFPDTQAYAAMLQIADDNMGHPMLEHTHYNLPVSFALSFRKSISKYWGISAGLQYSYLSSESSIGEISEWIRRQKFHYIGLSVRLDRRLYNTRSFTFYAAGGGNIDKSVSGKLEQDFIIQKEKIHSNTENLNIKPFQFSLHTNLGIQYNISPAIGAFAEPGIVYYFNDGSLKNTIRDEHPLNFNLQLGLRWNY